MSAPTALMKVLADVHPDDRRTLTLEFEVADSTVLRWRRDTARPHPLLAAQIRRRARELIAARLEPGA